MSRSPAVAVIHTDGSALRNPDGPGGWAAAIEYPDGSLQRLAGFDPMTTNNRMEMMAALSGIKALLHRCGALGIRPPPFVVYTDSQYLQHGMKEWLSGWKRRGWFTAQGEPVKNDDLWRELDKVCSELAIDWRWVRGHAGHPMNEMADKMAKCAAVNQESLSEVLTATEVASAGAMDLLAGAKARRTGPLDIDLTMSNDDLAKLVRAVLGQANGRIVRLRETM